MISMSDDLKRSGLTTADARKLGMKMLSPSDARRAVGHSVAGYLIPYFGYDGKQTKFRRLRVLDPDAQGAKYRQRKGSKGSALYLPPTMKWSAIRHDSDIPLLITEGEKKSAAACKAGFATVGLGGVWNVSDEDGRSLFEGWTFKGRPVFIVFDSDARWNEQVCLAMDRLGSWLASREARVFEATLPEAGAEKVGLDDFLMGGGDLRKHLSQARPFFDSPLIGKNTEGVRALMQRYWLLPGGNAFDSHTDTLMKHVHAKNDTEDLVYYDADENGKLREIHPWKAFSRLRGQYSNKVDGLGVFPDEGRIVIRDKHRYYNRWKGFAVEPKPGTIEPWLKLLHHVLDGDEDAVQHIIHWLAHRVQRPAERMNHMILIWGDQRGAGKSSIMTPVLEAIGDDHAASIEPAEMFGRFNQRWQLGTVVTSIEELHMQTDRANRSVQTHLKLMITNNNVTIEEKYAAAYSVRNVNAFFATSNYHDALEIEDETERRYWVWHSHAKSWPKKEADQYHSKWMAKGGPAALLDYLLKVEIPDSFSSMTPPPKTKGFMEMLSSTQAQETSGDSALAEFFATGSLDMFASDIVAARDIAFVLSQQSGESLPLTVVGRAINQHTSWPRKHLKIEGIPLMLYALRNEEVWTSRSKAEWREAYIESKKLVARTV